MYQSCLQGIAQIAIILHIIEMGFLKKFNER